MEHEICLSAVELYFLGRLMQAKYIDYCYIAMMEDIEKHYKSAESSAISALSKKKIVDEDFTGNVEVNAEYEALFKPVFEGMISTSAEILMPSEAGENIYTKMHILDDHITKAAIAGKTIRFSRFGEEQLEPYLRSLTGTLTDEAPPEHGDDMKASDRMIVLRSNTYAGDELLMQINICHGRLYVNQGNDTFKQISVEEYLEFGKLVLGGMAYVTQE